MTLVAAAFVLLGSLLPWASAQTVFGSISIAGTDGDGVITLVLALIAGVVLLALRSPRPRPLWVYLVLLVTTALSAIVGVYDLVHISNIGGNQYAHVSAGPGIWLVTVGSLVATASAVQLMRERRGDPAT